MTAAIGLVALLFGAALLFSSVGHGGASGFLAAMAFYDVAPDVMRPVALMLNLFAAALTTARFRSAGHFDRVLFLPLMAGSLPGAVIGGFLAVPGWVFKPLLALALTAGAVRLAWPSAATSVRSRSMPVWAGVATGAVIGILSGLTGVGGGIYLTPLLVFCGWAETKKAAGVSAAFILVNSAAALIGRLSAVPSLPPELPIWAVAVVTGSAVGSTLGSRCLASFTLRRLLAVVLVVAASKFALG